MNPGIRRIQRTEEFSVKADRLFSLLITPSDIRRWWGASSAIVLPKAGGFWCATWGQDEDKPDYIAKATITRLEAPKCLVLENYLYFQKRVRCLLRQSFERSLP